MIVTGVSLPAYTLVFNKLFKQLHNVLLEQVFGSVLVIKSTTLVAIMIIPTHLHSPQLGVLKPFLLLFLDLPSEYFCRRFHYENSGCNFRFLTLALWIVLASTWLSNWPSRNQLTIYIYMYEVFNISIKNLEHVEYRECLLTFILEKLCLPDGLMAMLLCNSWMHVG